MIRPLRRRHDRIFVLLLIVLPMVVVSALAVRPDEALLRVPTPDILAPPPPSAPGEQPWLDVDLGRLPRKPALLLYWVPDLAVSPGAEGMLPGGARLLGAVRSYTTARFPLPSPAADGAGALLLYSLGHQRVVGEPVLLDTDSLTSPVLVGEPADGGAGR